MKVAISGASGLVGSTLAPRLAAAGHEVVRLVRRDARSRDEAAWDPVAGTIDRGPLEGTDAVVHLAGENLAGGLWTAARKARLRTSRIDATRLLAEALAGLKRPPAVLVSASAVGYYGGGRGSAWLTEQDPPGTDFLGRLAVDWEAANQPARAAGIRVVNARFGVALSTRGGALGKMLLPFRLGLGGVVGPGTQYLSWIALDDLVAALEHLLAPGGLSGPVNVAAPEPVTNAEFTATLGRVLGRPTLIPLPAFAVRAVFGEMGDATLLSSMRVRSTRLVDSGFRFGFPELEAALRHVLGRLA